MKAVIDSNKRIVLNMSRAIAKRANLPIPTEEDLIEEEGLFYIDLNIKNADHAKLPKGLFRNSVGSKVKKDIINKEKNKKIMS